MCPQQLGFDERTLAPDHFRNHWVDERCPKHREFAALTCLLESREQVCVLCAQCPQCFAFGSDLCTCTMGCPEQDRSGILVDWSEPYDGGRFGLILEGEVRCAAYNTSCRRGNSIYSEGLSGPTRSTGPDIVWQYSDGCIVHYRCAPDEARLRYQVHTLVEDDEAPAYPARTRMPVEHEVFGIAGRWLFLGRAWSAIDEHGRRTVEDRPILWERAPQGSSG